MRQHTFVQNNSTASESTKIVRQMASSLEKQWTQQLEAQKELVLRDLQTEVLEYHKKELTREVSAATLVMRIDEMNAKIK